MTDDAKQAWGQVGERFSALGRRIADHYQASGEEAEAREAEQALQRAAKEIVAVVQRGAETVEKTFKDQDAGRELTQAFNALGDAITATAEETADAIRGRKGPKGSEGGGDEPGGSGSSA